MDLNSFDFIVGVVVLLSMVFAIYRGFFKSFISFIGWILSIVVGLEIGPFLAPIFRTIAVSDAMSTIMGFALIFVACAVLMAFVNNVIIKHLEDYLGGLLDRSFGLMFGFLRGCFIASVGFYMMTMVVDSLNVEDEDKFYDPSVEMPKWAKTSESIILLKRGADMIAMFIPRNFEDELHKTIMESSDDERKAELPSTRAEKIRAINKVLNSLPHPVLNEVNDSDLITLQDMSAQPDLKAQILEEIAQKFYKYNHEKMLESRDHKDMSAKNSKYHKIMMMLENEIWRLRISAKSNAESNAE